MIEGLVCEHSQMYSRRLLGFTDFSAEEQARFQRCDRASCGPTPRPGGSPSTYRLMRAISLVAAPEALSLLRDLTELATQREFVYSHEWRQYDLVIWDNRRTMHRARPFPSKNLATCVEPRCGAKGRRRNRSRRSR